MTKRISAVAAIALLALAGCSNTGAGNTNAGTGAGSPGASTGANSGSLSSTQPNRAPIGSPAASDTGRRESGGTSTPTGNP